MQDVKNLNDMINACTRLKTTAEMIEICNKATIAISKVNTIEEVIEDAYVKAQCFPHRTRKRRRRYGWRPAVHDCLSQGIEPEMTFPPRFGEHNTEIYGKIGYSDEKLAGLKEKGVI